MADTIRVAVTGAAGQVAYAMLGRLGHEAESGEMNSRRVARVRMLRRVDLEMVRVNVRGAAIGGEEPAETLDRGAPVRSDGVTGDLRQQAARRPRRIVRRAAGTDAKLCGTCDMTGRCAAWERASVWAISRSKPVAITVTLTISPSDSSMLAPQMMLASS